MENQARIYLDNAATSWPKPEPVYQAVEHAMRHVGAAAGRSAYGEAALAEQIVSGARRSIATLIGVSDWRRIVFTANGTDSLNMALYGSLREGDHVISSVADHNSVLRPLRYLRDSRGITVTLVGCDGQGRIDPDEVRKSISPRTRMISLIHASNVTGAIQPLEQIGAIARERDLLFLVDAAQSAGHMPIDVGLLHADLVAAPGHKGLLGPLGTGVLYVGPRCDCVLEPYRQGGAGGLSHEERQPRELPDKFEAGNLNVPGIAGLNAGVVHLTNHDVRKARASELELAGRLLGALRSIPQVTIYGPENQEERVGVVSLNIAGYSPQEAAAVLDANWRIQSRAGLHCAPLMHQALGTIAADGRSGGTLRLSIGYHTTTGQIDAACEAIAQLAQAQS